MEKVRPENVIPKWYESGASAGELCEKLLASKEWQSVHTASYNGLVRRLELMAQIGLPKMRVISADTIEKLGRIPRSNEKYAEDALEVVLKNGKDLFNSPNTVIVFFSHRWLRPNWCKELLRDLAWGSPERSDADIRGFTVGDVDDEHNSKAKSLIEWSKWMKYFRNKMEGTFDGLTLEMKVYFWIDWPCVDQLNPGPDMAALPAYVSISHLIAAAWTDEYAGRAWCQVKYKLSQ